MKTLHKFSAQILLTMLGIGLITALAYSLVLYRVQTEESRNELEHIAEAVMQPVVALATRGVDGGNLMKLRGKDATALYTASKLLYLQIEGTSRGSPKTAFSKALPPKAIEHRFQAAEIDGERLTQSLKRISDSGIDEQNWLYVVRLPLPDVTNGGKLTAIFSAESLKGGVWRTLKSISLVTLVVLVGIVLLALLFGRLVSRPVIAIAQGIREISNTLDLARRLDVQTTNEIGQTATAFNDLVEKLQQLISEVDRSSKQLVESSGTINQSTQQVTERFSQQQDETSQVATAMTEMTAVIEEVAGNASTAAESAEKARQEAAGGQQLVTLTVRLINELADEVSNSAEVIDRLGNEAQNIGGVLDVIRGIAEQTNLLALNAAIEAARAGESGRGFAVVADEVRTLASRTQKSTEEINSMIERLQKGADDANRAIGKGQQKVVTAVEQAGTAGSSLQEITTAVNQITDMNAQIALSVKEQANVAEEINQNLVRISQLTEHAGDDVQNNADSSEQLATVANQLMSQVARFKV